MKKMLFGLMSATMLFAASCSNDVAMLEDTGNEALVSLKVSTPEIASRAYSDGTTATHLQYAVYDRDGQYLSDLTQDDLTIKGSTTVDLKLTTGNNYTVIFWAAAPDAPYTVDFAAKAMTVDYDAALSNDEARDAFYCIKNFDVDKKLVEVNVELKRPFAQLNIGTADYEDSKKAGYEPTLSYVKVPVYKTLNFSTETREATVADSETVTFAYNTINREERFPVAGNEYIAMNYLLVPATKELVEVEFGYKEVNGIAAEAEKVRTIGSVPVQRNYRTNIFGNILTSDVDINVTINPEYETPDNYVFDAFERGGVATLVEDMEIGHTLYVRAGVKAVLNLNGKTLKNNAKNTATDVIVVEEGAELTINGEGTVEAVSGNDGYAIIAEGTVIINGGTYKAGLDAEGNPNAVVYARGNGQVIVNGGEFPNENNSTFVLNKKDANRATTTIEVKGGKFYGFNPADNAAEGAGTNFLAEGYISLDRGEYFEVVSGAVVTTADEFKAAAANAALQCIYIAADLDFGTQFVSVSTDKVILGNGYKFIAGGTTKTKNYALGLTGVNVTINDLVLNGGGGLYITGGSNVEVNNVTLKANYSASGRHLIYVNNSVLTVNSGEFEVLRTSSYYFSMQNNARAYVKGGTWAGLLAKGQAPVYTDGGAQLEISGGKFYLASYPFNPTAYLAAGYKAERVGDYMEVSAE